MRTRNVRSQTSQPGAESSSDVASTSSDEQIQIQGRAGGKRLRKYYRPEEEEEAETSSGSSDEEDLEEEDEDAEEGEESARRKFSKRRKQQLSGCSSLDIPSGRSEPYDEEEAAFRRALSLSMKDAIEVPGSSSQDHHDALQESTAGDFSTAEEAALQQALAKSLAEPESHIGETGHDRGVREQSRCQLGPATSSEGMRTAAAAAAGKQGGQGSRAAFPAPSIAMVEQAFRMLDPTGSGCVNRQALQGVANKLLQKDLDDDLIDAMMMYAEHATGNGARVSESITPDVFKALVAKFSKPAPDAR